MKTTGSCCYCGRDAYQPPNGNRFSTCLKTACLQRRKEDHAKTRPVQIICQSCGKPAMKYPHQSRSGVRVCSLKCWHDWRMVATDAKFDSRCVVDGDCLRWTGALNVSGYGKTAWYGSVRGAHQVAWERANGRRVPDGLFVLHTCDNRWCVKPDHLYIGTAADNSRDAVSRHRLAFGVRNHWAKLTDSDVFAIRASSSTAATLGSQYGVSAKHVQAIRAGKEWKHLLPQKPGAGHYDAGADGGFGW